MKRVFAVFAAVVMLFSATACGDSDSESETAKGSSAENLNGTYRYADIDGFGYLEDGPIRNYAVFDDGRFEWIVCGDQYSDKDYYKEYGYDCKETGSYEVSDGVISLKYDDINTKEELFEQFPSIIDMYNRKDDSEKEAYIKEIIEYQSKIRKDNENNIRLAVDEDKKVIYEINDPHLFRKAAYRTSSSYAIETINNYKPYETILKITSNTDKYCMFSSEDEFNENVSKEDRDFIERIFNEAAKTGFKSSSKPGLERYTAEEGFTRNLDLSKHSWLWVTKGSSNCTLVVGESADSDVFNSFHYYTYDRVGDSTSFEEVDKEISNNFHSIRDVYNYYHSLNQS